jgi:hypothetical protein
MGTGAVLRVEEVAGVVIGGRSAAYSSVLSEQDKGLEIARICCASEMLTCTQLLVAGSTYRSFTNIS